MKHFRGLGKHLMAGLFATALVVGMVGTSFAAPAKATPNGTWTYKAVVAGSTYNGTMAITQFKYSSSKKCWLATITKSGSSYTIKGTVSICGTKLSAKASGTYNGLPVTATASGSTNTTYTKMSAKFSAEGGLLTGSLTATK